MQVIYQILQVLEGWPLNNAYLPTSAHMYVHTDMCTYMHAHTPTEKTYNAYLLWWQTLHFVIKMYSKQSVTMWPMWYLRPLWGLKWYIFADPHIAEYHYSKLKRIFFNVISIVLIKCAYRKLEQKWFSNARFLSFQSLPNHPNGYVLCKLNSFWIKKNWSLHVLAKGFILSIYW